MTKVFNLLRRIVLRSLVYSDRQNPCPDRTSSKSHSFLLSGQSEAVSGQDFQKLRVSLCLDIIYFCSYNSYRKVAYAVMSEQMVLLSGPLLQKVLFLDFVRTQ
jgi:hypothetical protein